ncbi:ribosomal protein S12 methylthiotransferase accessory factor [Amycolatopsis marina]|uniref:Ribosomal protein S12 methylthiotransferase accessory factor n=1 Tax=Amycolatopsis marina TaxID=490629 RepID=A0A1I0ZHY1_9PSEU|nr:TOMM precursor leader peptide-binding protein [Amycolatopsis marina]SFB25264.1 ribosomal protein S12 methylthiotransferase accessory factor [Amycolatopsis marina]
MTAGADAAGLLGFKRHLRAEVSEGKAAFLFSERGVTALQGTHIASLAALLDGTRDLESLFRARPGGLAPEQVARLVGELIAADLVTRRTGGELAADERALAYWDACGVDAGAATGTVNGRVDLFPLGEQVDGDAVRLALGAAGFDVGNGAADQDAAQLSVVLCDDYLDPLLADIDTAHRAAGRPWLLAKPVGAQVWIGPTFLPGTSGCWHCLSHRLWAHRNAEACVQATLGRVGPASRPATAVPSLTSAAAHLISLEAAKWFAGHRYQGQRCVWTFDSRDLTGRLHELRRRPQCRECGDTSLMAERARRPVRLRVAPKVSSSGGGHRTMTPGQVLETFGHLVSPVTGIIKEITRNAAAPAFVNSFRSGPNVARNLMGLDGLRASLRSENGGKGTTPLDAEVGALCEAAERYSGSFHGDEYRVRGSLESLGDVAIHPNDCTLFDARQYERRSEWNRDHSPFNYVFDPVSESTVLDWTPLWSLTELRHRMLPTGLLYFGAPAAEGSRCVRADSNGNAAGSSLEDAILQGALELVERDAVALWWYNRTKAPGVDIAAFGDPWMDELRDHYAGIGRELWVLDVTSDLGIPAMTAISRRTDSARENIMFGFGAHLDPRTALRRALSELNQLLPAVLTDRPMTGDKDAARWMADATVGNQPYLLPDTSIRARVPGDFTWERTEDVRDDVDSVVSTIAERGMDMLVLDQTRPDVGIPVVKVVIPGMRSFWARFAPGRLYDVPVRLGRRAEPTKYEDLNPMPLFL